MLTSPITAWSHMGLFRSLPAVCWQRSVSWKSVSGPKQGYRIWQLPMPPRSTHACPQSYPTQIPTTSKTVAVVSLWGSVYSTQPSSLALAGCHNVPCHMVCLAICGWTLGVCPHTKRTGLGYQRRTAIAWSISFYYFFNYCRK